MTDDKHSRGRPRGSGQYVERDREKLSKFTEGIIVGTFSKLAPFLRSEGYSETDISRAQIKWRGGKDRYLNEALLQRDATRPASMWQMLATVCNILARVDKMAVTAATQFDESFERERQRAQRLESAGLGPRSTIDFQDAPSIASAVQRYEAGINNRPTLPDGVGLSELPLPLKVFIMSYMLHDFSIVLAESAAQKSKVKRHGN